MPGRPPPRGLVPGSEAELATTAGADRLGRCWSTRGEPGSFRGAGGLMLHYLALRQADPLLEEGAIVISSGRTETMREYKEVVHDRWRNGWSL